MTTPSPIPRLVARWLLKRLDGSLTIEEPDGTTLTLGTGGPPAASLTFADDRMWSILFGGSRALADAYADGLWESADPVAVTRLAARNMPPLDRFRGLGTPLLGPWAALRAITRPRGRTQRRRDVIAHYDIGNELFSRMLDATMTYSCAVFASNPSTTLEEAQFTKLELVCEKLQLGPEDRVLEIGSGWGSFAIHAAATRGCHVTTTTISPEQHAYASELVSRAGLSDRVTVLDSDYRELRGRYDKLVSIEMIEAVGWRRFGDFLERCSDLLVADGAMLLQAITIDDRAYDVEKASRSFIKEYIFPGGSLPSLAVITSALSRRTDLRAVDLEDLTEDYVRTLQCWRERFEQAAPELDALGYDDRFKRIWRLYLAYCEAGFAERRIGDVQILLTKPRSRLLAPAWQ